MILGQLAGSFVFDRTRGVIWWQAPLYSALASSFVAISYSIRWPTWATAGSG